MKLFLSLSIFVISVFSVNAQNTPIDNCICTAYGVPNVYINKEGNIEVEDFNNDYKIFSPHTGDFLGRSKTRLGTMPQISKENFKYNVLSKKVKRGITYTATAQQWQEDKLIKTEEKELFAKGDDFYFHEYPNYGAGITFVKTKDKLFFLSPYRIDTLKNGKAETADFFKNIGGGFHPGDISASSYALCKNDVGAVLTKTGVLINAKDGIIGYNYPAPRIDGTYQQRFSKFWTDKPYLTYETENENKIVTLNYETGEIIRIVTIPDEVIKKFRDLQKIPPTFNIIDDTHFLMFATQHDPNSYVWYFNNGAITPLCDVASKDEYANAKKRSADYYAWKNKNWEQQQAERNQADAKWHKENGSTQQQCGACGGKGGTSVENVNSASGVGYRTVYQTDYYGNKTYVTSNYGKTYYPCKRCGGTGQVTVKNQ